MTGGGGPRGAPSFRRKPESILVFFTRRPREGGDPAPSLFLARIALTRPSSLSGFARHPWRASHFLCLHKESNQRNAPSRSRSRGHPCPRDCASRFRGLPAVRPCTVGKLAAILAAIASRLFLHLLAATWRDPGRAKRGSPCRRSCVFCSAFDPGPLCEAAEVGRKQPRAPHAGRAMDGAHSATGQEPCRRTRSTAANRRLHRRRVTEGAFLWLLSLCKQRK